MLFTWHPPRDQLKQARFAHIKPHSFIDVASDEKITFYIIELLKEQIISPYRKIQDREKLTHFIYLVGINSFEDSPLYSKQEEKTYPPNSAHFCESEPIRAYALRTLE